MKEAVQRILKNPAYLKLFHWGKLVAITGGAQAIVQGAGLLCGILVIRLLPTQEYAFYTLANTMLGAMAVLGDGGISTGVMALSGKVWMDKEKAGVILATGLDLRKKFAIISLLIATPALMYLLVHHGASWLFVLLITASLVPAFLASLSDSLLEIVPKLNQDILVLQRNQITVSIGRLLLSGISLFIFPFTFIAILASGIPRMYGNIRLRKIAGVFADEHQKPDAQIRNNILDIVKRIMPLSIYYCLSSQITIWLVSLLGSTLSIAQAGALGRLVMLLTLFSILFSTLIIPRFSRLPGISALLLNKFLLIHLGLIVLCSAIVLVVYIFPEQILFVLGKNYAGLQYELLLNIIAGCVGMISGVSFNLCTSRGYIITPIIAIPINLITLVSCLYFFNISTLRGVLYLNIIVDVIQVIMHFLYGILKIQNR